MNIYFLEAYYSGSHAYFCDGLTDALSKSHSSANIFKFTLPGRHWRSRLQKSHIALAHQVNRAFVNKECPLPDALIVTSLTDCTSLRGLLTPPLRNVPIIVYMHENQMSYPLDESSPVLERDRLMAKHVYPGYHLNQSLGADILVFNSQFHREAFFNDLESFLKRHMEKSGIPALQLVKEKSQVIPIGIEFPEGNLPNFEQRPLRILWNHRWEYDKNPRDFFSKVSGLIAQNPTLEVSLVGESNGDHPEFTQFKETHPKNVVQFGILEKRSDYLKELTQCRLLPVTSHHDFLGLATLEAIVHGVCPLLPHRLVYPELIPQELHGHLLYRDEEGEFQTKALKLLQNGLNEKQQNLLLSHLQELRWESVAKRWEKIFPPKT